VSSKSWTILLLFIGTALSVETAFATPLPGLTNLNFLSYTGAAPKNYFNNVQPTGWTGGSGLIFIAAPGTSSSSPATACGTTYLSTYGCPSTLAIPGGYNFVEADGNPNFESGFNYNVTGLVPGETYTLSFYQAASQQRGFVGDTTEQWIVSLGTEGLSACPGCLGGGNSYYFNTDPLASVVATPLMNTPSGGMTDWNFVSVSLTANAANQVLSFLAWGDDGNTVNLPPMVFLTGVNSGPGLVGAPEPGSGWLMISTVLFVAAGLVVRRFRNAAVS
jgi:hypothetical protein